MSDLVKGLLAGSAAGVVLTVLYYRAAKKPAVADGPVKPPAPAAVPVAAVSTTNSGIVPAASGGGANVYETQTAVSEYLMFHFGDPADVLPYENGPKSALQFAERTAAICAEYCSKYNVPLGRALDVGCAVGGATFQLSKYYSAVLGVDFSHAFVDTANSLKVKGQLEYVCTKEGEIKESKIAKIPADVKPLACAFEQGDACALRADIGTFNVVHAVNLLCRLPDPQVFLNRLSSLVADRGLVVLISPYSWLPGYTARDKWLGGKVEDGKPISSKRSILDLLEPDFELVHEENVPFLIREHARKYQWGCSNCLVLRKR